MTLENMKLPREWFEDEVRDGFFVSCIMKRNWSAQLEVLREFDNVCKKLGLTWYLDSGTLLGAVRHHGFIPWDDDIDISMIREDFDVLRMAGLKLLPEGYYLKDCETDISGATSCFRISNSRQTLLREEHLKRYRNWPYGNGFDIFVLENWTDDEEKDREAEQLIQSYYKLWGMLCAGTKTDNPRMAAPLEHFRNTSGIDLRKEKHQAHTVMKQICATYKRFANEKSGKYREFLSNRVIFKKEWFGESRTLSFEGIELPVPSEYICVVRKYFGDYKIVSRKGGWHNYPSYGELEKGTLNEEGIYFGRYTFNKKHIGMARAGSPREKTAQLLNMIDTLKQGLILANGSTEVINDFLLTAIELTAALRGILTPLFKELKTERNFDSANQHLSADTAKTLIKPVHNEGDSYGDQKRTGLKKTEIEILDILSTCENEIREMLSETGKYSGERFFAILDSISTGVNKALNERMEIVFLPCRAAWWESMESAWQKAMALNGANVYVCPIPWYEMPEPGVRGKKHDESTLFPDSVSITAREAYDIEHRHPEVIVIQMPYDNSSLDIQTDEKHYSYYLRNFTDRLIYIPPFVPDDPDEDDLRSVKALNYLIE